MTTTVTESSPNPRTEGASPEGAANPQAAAQAVRQMFSDIAPRYDLLNHVLSMNVDRLWVVAHSEEVRCHPQRPDRLRPRFMLRNGRYGVRRSSAALSLARELLELTSPILCSIARF